jgi:hypothetical protein
MNTLFGDILQHYSKEQIHSLFFETLTNLGCKVSQIVIADDRVTCVVRLPNATGYQYVDVEKNDLVLNQNGEFTMESSIHELERKVLAAVKVQDSIPHEEGRQIEPRGTCPIVDQFSKVSLETKLYDRYGDDIDTLHC